MGDYLLFVWMLMKKQSQWRKVWTFFCNQHAFLIGISNQGKSRFLARKIFGCIYYQMKNPKNFDHISNDSMQCTFQESYNQPWYSGYLDMVHLCGTLVLNTTRKWLVASRTTGVCSIWVRTYCYTIRFWMLYPTPLFLMVLFSMSQLALITEVHLSTLHELAHWSTKKGLFA